MEMELGRFLGLVWMSWAVFGLLGTFVFCLMAFWGFVFISINWLVGSGEEAFWGLIVTGRVFFELGEEFSFLSCVSSCLVFALLSIYFLGS